jgi:hypothetical protein
VQSDAPSELVHATSSPIPPLLHQKLCFRALFSLLAVTKGCTKAALSVLMFCDLYFLCLNSALYGGEACLKLFEQERHSCTITMHKRSANQHCRVPACYTVGLLQIVSVKVPDPEFEGQTKARLGNPGVKALTAKVVTESLEDFLRLNTDTLRVVVDKALLAQKAADAAKRARELVKRASVLSRAMLPGKLADCSNQDPHSAEIFIVEGDSAGGSAKQVRSFN